MIPGIPLRQVKENLGADCGHRFSQLQGYRRKPATIYRYKVTAYRKSGSVILESAFSSELKTATAPVKLSVKSTMVAGGRVKLTWPKKAATKYVVYMKRQWKIQEAGHQKTKEQLLQQVVTERDCLHFRVRAFKKVTSKRRIYSAYSRVIKVKR